MKSRIKQFILFELLCLLFLFFSWSTSSAIEIRNYPQPIQSKSASTLPNELIIIEESAFEGTAIEAISLPNNVRIVESKAFAEMQKLRFFKIPQITEQIADNAFEGSCEVIISGAPDSYAKVWAKKNKIPFFPVISIFANNSSSKFNAMDNARTNGIVLTSDNIVFDRECWLFIDFTEKKHIGNRTRCYLERGPPNMIKNMYSIVSYL